MTVLVSRWDLQLDLTNVGDVITERSTNDVRDVVRVEETVFDDADVIVLVPERVEMVDDDDDRDCEDDDDDHDCEDDDAGDDCEDDDVDDSGTLIIVEDGWYKVDDIAGDDDSNVLVVDTAVVVYYHQALHHHRQYILAPLQMLTSIGVGSGVGAGDGFGDGFGVYKQTNIMSTIVWQT